jgi:hypothetical protein
MASLGGLAVLLSLSSMLSAARFNQKRILFDVIYTSALTGSTAGFFIDSEGNVYTFRNQLPPIKFLGFLIEAGRADEDPYTTRELFQFYGYSNSLVGKIDANTLQEMRNLIEPASDSVLDSDNPLTPADCESQDAGIYIYRAFTHYGDSKVHAPVNLYVMGDKQAVNVSQEGIMLHQWLETICVDNDYFSGCKPSSQICRP